MAAFGMLILAPCVGGLVLPVLPDPHTILTGAGHLYNTYLGQPGFVVERMDVMDADGVITHPITALQPTASGPILIFFAAATRCGGILPDELPFNIVQKALRAVLPKVRVLCEFTNQLAAPTLSG